MERLGRYELLAMIAEDLPCEWYLGRALAQGGPYRALAEEVLICFFHLEGEPELLLSELLWEARLFSGGELPGIQRVLAWSETVPVFCALERAEGWTLSRLLRHRSPLSPRSAVALCRALCRALGALHGMTDREGGSLGVLYRAVNPETVMIRADGEVLLLNPGLQRLMMTIQRTEARRRAGLPVAYLSPEQVEGRVLDHRSDLFSLGTLLFELVTGQALFRRQNDLDTLKAIRACQVTPASRLGAPSVLEAIVERLVRYDPAERPGSAAEVDFWLELVELSSVWREPREALLGEVEAAGLLERPRLGVPDLFGNRSKS